MRPRFRTEPFPRTRKIVVDACRYGKTKHMIHGLVEVDVTEVRRRLAESVDAEGRHLSLTAYLIHCLARTVAEDPTVQAYRSWRRMVIFESVDVNTIVERDVHGVRLGSVHIVRAAERLSVAEIHADLWGARSRPVEARQHPFWYGYLWLPGFVRGWIWRIVGRFPRLVKRTGGTVSVTAFGMMFGAGGGWGIGLGAHTLGLAIGGIAERPVVVEGEIAIREMLSLTLSFDHDVVDGAPAARFARRLKERIESAEGIEA